MYLYLEDIIILVKSKLNAITATIIFKYEKYMFSCFCDLDLDLLGLLGICVVSTERNIYIWS